MPLSGSSQTKLTVTSCWCQPAALAGTESAVVMVGGVRSIFSSWLISVTLSARSTPCPGMVWLAPSVFTATGVLQLAMPLRLSRQSKFTVTAVLCQLAAFGNGTTLELTVGAVLSMFRLTLVLALLWQAGGGYGPVAWILAGIGVLAAAGFFVAALPQRERE